MAGNDWNGSARAFTEAARELGVNGTFACVVVQPDTNVERIVSARAVVRGSKDAFHVAPIGLSGLPFFVARRLQREIVSDGIDVVFVNSARMHYIAAMACRMAGRAAVIRRFPPSVFERKRMLGGMRSKLASRLAATSYVFSTTKDAQVSYIPRVVRHTAVVPLGVTVSDNYHSTGAGEGSRAGAGTRASAPGGDASSGANRLKYIVCKSDDSSRSRASIAIRALAMLVDRHSYLRLIIVGESKYDEDLRMQAAALRVLNLVSFVGNREDELEVMKRASVGWVVSERDTGGFSALDFMSVGVPVLAEQQSVAVNYILTSITGVLFPDKDPNSVAAIMAEMLSDPAKMETMGEAGHTRAKREFNLQKMVKGFEQIAEQTVKARY